MLEETVSQCCMNCERLARELAAANIMLTAIIDDDEVMVRREDLEKALDVDFGHEDTALAKMRLKAALEKTP